MSSLTGSGSGITVEEGASLTLCDCQEGSANNEVGDTTYTGGVITGGTGDSSNNGGVVTTEATCVEDGVKTYTCTVCEATYTEVIPGTGEHSWDDGVVITAATCVEDGVMTYTCTVCGATYTEVIPTTGHIAGEAVTENYKATTCTEDGSYDEVVYCTVCVTELSRETNKIAATGHTWGEWKSDDESTHTRECEVCGEAETGSHNLGDDNVCSVCAYEDGKADTYCKFIRWLIVILAAIIICQLIAVAIQVNKRRSE